MSTRLAGDVSITCAEVKIQLAAESVRFMLTLSEDSGNVWRYNVSEINDDTKNARVAFGRVISPDLHAAIRQAGTVIGQGYEPGTVERGLFDMMVTEPPTHIGLEAGPRADAR